MTSAKHQTIGEGSVENKTLESQRIFCDGQRFSEKRSIDLSRERRMPRKVLPDSDESCSRSDSGKESTVSTRKVFVSMPQGEILLEIMVRRHEWLKRLSCEDDSAEMRLKSLLSC